MSNESFDIDDLLFEGRVAQPPPHSPRSDNPDDDLLFAGIEDEPTSWDSEDMLDLISRTAPCEASGSTDITSNSIAQTGTSPHIHTGKPKRTRDRHWVVARIEAILESIVDSLLEQQKPLSITLKSRAALSRRKVIAADGDGQIPEPKERNITFPGATVQEAWNFTVLLRILEIIHSGLVDNTIMTKRDIYYRHPDLFGKQSVVDRFVDDLACTFSITRSQLNVTAAAKGMVAGNFSLTRESGHQLSGMSDKEGLLVPVIGDNDVLDIVSVRWILVIEKEATFRSFLSSSRWPYLREQGVVVTAKGYPDIASRRFLRQLADRDPRIPIYAFMDLDPDGIAILSTYKYGSYRLAHEDVAPNDTLALSLPDIRWLGVKSHHVSRTPVSEGDTDASAMLQLRGLMNLRQRDRQKAIRMLEWGLCAEDGPEQEWRRELQSMLMLNIKAEMQILDELPCGLVSWLSSELGQLHGQSVNSAGSDDGMLF